MIVEFVQIIVTAILVLIVLGIAIYIVVSNLYKELKRKEEEKKHPLASSRSMANGLINRAHRHSHTTSLKDPNPARWSLYLPPRPTSRTTCTVIQAPMTCIKAINSHCLTHNIPTTRNSPRWDSTNLRRASEPQ